MTAVITPADRPGSYLLTLDAMPQSHVDLEDPTRLVFDYVRRMADVVDAARPTGERLRIVHVGGAAMTLPRYVAATRPGSSQIVLEPAAAVTAQVRAELPLPPRSGIKVRPVDGRTGLAQLRDDSADLIVLDAFAGGRVPADLVTVQAFAEAGRVLDPVGLLVLNLVDRAPFTHTRRVLAAVRAAFDRVVVVADSGTLRGKRRGNLVVTAGAALPEAALARPLTSTATPYRLLAGAEVTDRLGGGRPFTDQDTEPGPAPD